jgi:hypothetical protein
VSNHTPDASKSNIRTPVKLRSPEDWGYHDVIEDADGEFLCECSGGRGEELASVINTHAAEMARLRAMEAALTRIASMPTCWISSHVAESLLKEAVALANAAKVGGGA